MKFTLGQLLGNHLFHLKLKLQFETQQLPILIKLLGVTVTSFLKWDHLGSKSRVFRHWLLLLWPALHSITSSNVGKLLSISGHRLCATRSWFLCFLPA